MKVKIELGDEVTVENAIYAINEILGDTENLEDSNKYVFFSRAVYVTDSHKILIKKTKKNKITFYVETGGWDEWDVNEDS
jgi:hypothetical protein